MIKKIYVHHYHTDKLFQKLFHNTEIIEHDNNTFLIEYKGNEYSIIFDTNIHDHSDGLHLLDYFTIYDQTDDPKFSDIQIKGGEEEFDILTRIKEITIDKKGWLLNILRAEKVICKDIHDGRENHIDLDRILRELKNHNILCDNIILSDDTRGYEHITFPITTTLFQWKDLVQINIFTEFGKLYERLNYEYDIGYSVRNHKTFRNKLLSSLSNIPNKDRLFLSRNTFYSDDRFYKNGESILNKKTNIKKIESDTSYDFDKNDIQITHLGNDLLFDVLSKSKMTILDESWVFKSYDYHSQYLSEKTLILILSKKPFISTHSYPIDILQKILDIPNYPNYKEIKECQGDVKKISTFVNNFLDDFDENYKQHKNWVEKVHEILMKKVRTDNSILDFIEEGSGNVITNKII